LGKRRQAVNDGDQAIADEFQALSHEDKVGVVGDVATRGAQVNDGPGRRAHVAIRLHVRHHVVTKRPFVALGRGEIDVVLMRL
jgi:hypothetical protein